MPVRAAAGAGRRCGEAALSRGPDGGQDAASLRRRRCRFVDEFPMTVTGKIQKSKMRETSIRELGLEKAAEIETA